MLYNNIALIWETPAPAPAFGVLESVDDLMAKYDVSEEQIENPVAEVDE